MRALTSARRWGDRALGPWWRGGDTVVCDDDAGEILIRRRRFLRPVTRSVRASSIERVELFARGSGGGHSHIQIRCAGGDRIEIFPPDRPQGRPLAVACALAQHSGTPLHMVHV